jgi:hypothetical protein
MARPARRPTPSRCRVAVREPRKTLLVFCEGARTEPEYLEALRRQPAVQRTAAVDIRIDLDYAGFKPLGLVRKAIVAHDRATREQREIDEFWCLFDVEWPENHPGLKEAARLAAENGILLAVSNPCFELWLALHFADQEAWLDNDGARRLRRASPRPRTEGLRTWAGRARARAGNTGCRDVPTDAGRHDRLSVAHRIHSLGERPARRRQRGP